MKHIAITIMVVFGSMIGVFAQDDHTTENLFYLSADMVNVYGFEADTKGSRFEYQFEDDYTLKITNKVYKVALFFDQDQREAVQKLVSSVMGNGEATSGFEQMSWKKTAENGKTMHEVKVEDKKLKITVFRKQIDVAGFAEINELGKAFLKEINN